MVLYTNIRKLNCFAGDGARCAALCALYRDTWATRTIPKVPANYSEVRGNVHTQMSGHCYGRGEMRQ